MSCLSRLKQESRALLHLASLIILLNGGFRSTAVGRPV